MTPLFKGPLRAPLRHLGAVCCDPRAPTSDACGGPFALNQHRARQRQGGPSGPWPVHVNPNTRPRPWPLGALATTGRAFVVLLCCRVVDAGPKPTASAPARPLHPAAGARGHGPVARAGHVHPTTRRSTVALSPCPAPLQLRASDACGGPGPGAQRAPTQQQMHLRHRDRLGSRACLDWSPGVGPSRCPAASMEGGPPAPFKKAGRAAGAIE